MPILAERPPTSSHAPTPRQTSANSARPRPLSMPMAPQQCAPGADAQHAGESATPRAQGPSATSTATPNGRQKPRSSNRVLGDYTLGKTLGAGSMGKVKLAYHNITGEKLAIKILPRAGAASSSSNNTPQTPEAAAKQASKDASKEIRTIREAAMSMLLHHPYICGMRELITHTNHYYMVSEYISGGQMLDYIISHGRLRERVARKFSRQIGSALDYCHRNNVVHRDLKIENILISETGNIKIIDFGLANLYNPAAHLATFCGSLYFAAPELLNAKVYTGPEVDVWSFGVVLYVLVCGKVPFDDQSMPALHAKIKRGLVEYPDWLSAECKHLLTRMLVINPAARAPLVEVLSHPWMTRGHGGPPDPHMLHREPLRADEIDKQVVKGMGGFEFGSEEDVERKLTEVLESDLYQRALQNWERKRQGRNGHGGISNASLTSYDSGLSDTVPTTPTKTKSRRFSGFDFYRRKLFSPGSSPPNTPNSPPSSTSHLSHSSLSDARESADPTAGFHPLISMYYLAREKMERERVYGPGHFASSQMSLMTRDEGQASSTVVSKTSTKVNGRTSTSQAPTSGDVQGAKADYTMALPRLPAPASTHYSDMSYQSPNVVPSPTAATFNAPQPRARDSGAGSLAVPKRTGEGAGAEKAAGEAGQLPAPTASAPPTPAKTALPRTPPAMTHRRSHSLSQRPTTGTAHMFKGLSERIMGGGTHHERDVPATAGPEVTSFAEKMGPVEPSPAQTSVSSGGDFAKEKSDLTSAKPQESEQDQETVHIPGANLVRKFGTLLGAGRGDSESRRAKRTSILGLSPRASRDNSEQEKLSSGKEKETEDPATPTSASPMPISQSQPVGAVHRRAQTILDPAGRAARHERRVSAGASFLAAAHGSLGRQRRPSTSTGGTPTTPRRGKGAFDKTDEEQEEADAGEQAEQDVDGVKSDDEQEHDREKEFKPLFLKGLFSVSTTTSKSPSVIKTDICKVLERMQIQYRQTKNGFECIHAPSIDLTSIQSSTMNASRRSTGLNSTHHGKDEGGIRRSLTKKVSKLSLSVKSKSEKERESIKEESTKAEKADSATLSSGTTDMSKSNSSSLNNLSSNAHTIRESTSQQMSNGQSGGIGNEPMSPMTSGGDSPETPTKTKHLPPIPRDFVQQQRTTSPAPPSSFRSGTMGTMEAEPEAFDTVASNSLAVRFEINIVKVPLLPLHGIQFRRVGGDGWQYQMLARRVLTELKL